MEYRRFAQALRANRLFWLICGGLLILNLLFYIGFIKRQEGRIHQLQRVYTEKRGAKVPARDVRVESYLKAGEDVLAFRENLQVKTSFAESVKELYDLLRKRDLGVVKMTYQPEPVEALGGVWKYSTSFTVTGAYANLKGLLADIQNSPSLFCIENLSFTNKSKDAEQIDMGLKIGMYFKEG